MSSAPVRLQRMRPEPSGGSGPPPPPLFPVVGVITDNSTITEGGLITFRIQRTAGPTNQSFAVHWAMTGNAADMTGVISGDASFLAEVMEIVITVQTVNRSGTQGDRGVTLTLSAPTNNATLDPAKTTASTLIRDDTPVPPVLPMVGVTPVKSLATEGDILDFTVLRTVDNPTSTAFTVAWAVASSGGTADFSGTTSGTLSFLASELSKSVKVQTVNRANAQGNRAINFTLSAPSGATLDPTKTIGVMTLQDFSTPGTSPVVGVTADETEIVETDTADYTVSRVSGSNTTAFDVHWVVTSSRSPADLTGVTSGNLSFASGDLTKKVSVATADLSSGIQFNRVLTLTLSAPTNGALLDPTHTSAGITLKDKTGSIIDADHPPKYQPVVPNNKIHWVGSGAPAGVKATYTGDYTGLKNALQACVGGEKVKVVNGTYTGAAVTMSKSGTLVADGSGHVMVEAVNQLGATINFQVICNGKYIWFSKFNLPWSGIPDGVTGYKADGGSFSIRRRGIWITNCKCTSESLCTIKPDQGSVENDQAEHGDHNISWNDLICDVDPGRWYVATISMFDWNAPNPPSPNTHFSWNKFRQNNAANNMGDGDKEARIAIFLETSKPDEDKAIDQTFRIHHNHFQGKYKWITYLKRQLSIEYNWYEWLSGSAAEKSCIFRHGRRRGITTYKQGGRIIGNAFKVNGTDGMDITVNGLSNEINGNRMFGSGGGQIALKGGGIPGPTATRAYTQSTAYTAVIDNPGFNVSIGHLFKEGATPNTDNSVYSEGSNGEGGYPTNIQIFRGGRGWTPSVSRRTNTDINGKPNPFPTQAQTYSLQDGQGGYDVITTITEADLTDAGCDAAGTTPPPPTGKWWEKPIRSGRAWASGPSIWWDRASLPSAANAFLAEERDVGLFDAICGSAKASADNVSHVATWDDIIGGALTAARDNSDTQFDWDSDYRYGFGPALAYLPNTLDFWMVWMIDGIPDGQTLTGTPNIWTQIIAGDHDAKYQKFGERIVGKMSDQGRSLNRLLIDMNHEMNQSNNYQVKAGQAANYKAAMERAINQMRAGAASVNPSAVLRFIHRPAFHADPGQANPGTYLSYCPNNVDVLSLSLHPYAPIVADSSGIDKLFNGGLNDGLGTGFYSIADLIAASDSRGLPVAFPEWSPEETIENATTHIPTPVADDFVRRFHDEILAKMAVEGRLVCDCVFSQSIRDVGYFQGTTPAGIAQWTRMVVNRKTLWSGTKRAAGTPTGVPANTVPPTIVPTTGLMSGGTIGVFNEGDWTNFPTGYAYQWREGTGSTFTNIVGATSKNFILTDTQIGKNVDCRVTASNSFGAGTAAFTTSHGPVLDNPSD